MTKKLIQEDVDIYQYPETSDDNKLGSVTIGDLHGNAVKLVYFLLRQNVIKFKDNVDAPAEAYSKFVELYERSDEIRKQGISGKITSRQDTIEFLEKKLGQYQILVDKKDKTEDEKSQLSKYDRENLIGCLKAAQEEKALFEVRLQGENENLRTILQEFNEFIDQLEIKDKNILVRLIGDELADRGSNDYFTLRVLGLLKDNKVNVNITISNHSNDFIVAYEKLFNKEGYCSAQSIDNRQKPSFLGLTLLFDRKLVSEEDVTRLVNAAYKPCLKIIDYALDENGINLFTHAPVRFDLIEKIAHHMGVVYDDSSKEALAASIDKINTKFAQAVEKNTVHEFCDVRGVENIDHMKPDEIIAKPLVNIIWNRWDQEQDTEEARPESKNGFSLNYTHGHDPYQSPLQQVTNLDTPCGKDSRAEAIKTMEYARKGLASDPSNTQYALYMANFNKYKVLVSDETGLNQKHDLKSIDQEFQDATRAQQSIDQERQEATRAQPVRAITGTFVGIGLALGVVVGLALVATGIFAPFGAGILGAVALAATLGGGLAFISGAFGFGAAKATAPAPVNTVLPEPLAKSGPNMESSTAMLVNQLGPRIASPASAKIAIIPDVASNASATTEPRENKAYDKKKTNEEPNEEPHGRTLNV